MLLRRAHLPGYSLVPSCIQHHCSGDISRNDPAQSCQYLCMDLLSRSSFNLFLNLTALPTSMASHSMNLEDQCLLCTEGLLCLLTDSLCLDLVCHWFHCEPSPSNAAPFGEEQICIYCTHCLGWLCKPWPCVSLSLLLSKLESPISLQGSCSIPILAVLPGPSLAPPVPP